MRTRRGFLRANPRGFARKNPRHHQPSNLAKMKMRKELRSKSLKLKPGVRAQKPPDPTMVTIEVPSVPQCSSLPPSSSMEHPSSMETMEGDPFDQLIADRIREKQQREQERLDREEQQLDRQTKPVSGAVVEAINGYEEGYQKNCSPEGRKKKIVDQIMSRGYPGMSEVIAKRAADAVVFDGLHMKHLIEALKDTDKMWAKDELTHGPGQFFQARMKRVCAQHGVRWRDRKRGDA